MSSTRDRTLVWFCLLAGAGAWVTACGGGGGVSGGTGGLGIPPGMCSSHVPVNNSDSDLMEPGGDCVGCHAQRGLTGFVFAGSVMASLHDDTNCTGLSGAVVHIVDANGLTIELTTNQSGNFLTRTPLPSAFSFPFYAYATHNGLTAYMTTTRSETETDCGACHTAKGEAGSPGRITVP